MPTSPRYPDAVRQQAIALSEKGKGYKAIAAALGVPRDTVRSWILRYRQSGQLGTVQDREKLFGPARKAYETTPASLWTIALELNLNYYNLRNFLRQYHPESQALHCFNKRKAALKSMVAQQIHEIHFMETQLLRQLEEEQPG